MQIKFKCKEFEIFLWKKRRFRLRWDSRNRKTWTRIPAQPKASFFPQKDFKFFKCILFFIITLLRIWFDVTVERVKTAIFNPTFKVSTRSTGTENRIYKKGAMKKYIDHAVKLAHYGSSILFDIWIIYIIQYLKNKFQTQLINLKYILFYSINIHTKTIR